VNKELVGTLGNFVNRCATQVDRHFDGAVPEGGEPGEVEAALVKRLAELLDQYHSHLESLQYRKATSVLRALWAEGNVYLELREPWRAIKTDRDSAAVTLRTALGVIRLVGHVSSPFIPQTSESIAATLPGAMPLDGLDPSLAATVMELDPGSPFVTPGLLFSKVDDDQLAEWVDRFGGPDD
jgi:methionyl-tRNA synthetase